MNPLDELKKLTSLFDQSDDYFQQVEHVAASTTPEPYKKMLVHDSHMTVTMESYHDCQVDVRVLAEHQDDDVYSRKIVLLKKGTDQVVQFGIVRFDLCYVTDAVRQEILSKKTPMGRVLINHNVLRHIDLGAILRIQLGPDLAGIFKTPMGETTYGRLATIFCNQYPAVDLLEITAPLHSAN